jgi:cytochrome c oxidase assembly protein subunit 11
MNPNAVTEAIKTRRWNAGLLALVAAGMFGFGFALVPLYNLICEWTGANGKNPIMLLPANTPEKPDLTRLVTVQFATSVNGRPDWVFKSGLPSLQVHPGKLYTVEFEATNQHDQAMTGQAVPSVLPWAAAKFIRKTECFCFRQQVFKAKERKLMPVRFMLDPALPKTVHEVTLSYTFFDAAEYAQANSANNLPKTN